MVSYLKTFSNKGRKIAAQKKVFFSANLGLVIHYSLSQFCKDQEFRDAPKKFRFNLGNFHKGGGGQSKIFRALFCAPKIF